MKNTNINQGKFAVKRYIYFVILIILIILSTTVIAENKAQ